MSYKRAKFFHFFLVGWGGKWDIHAVMKTEVTTTYLREQVDCEGNQIGEQELDIVANYYSGTPERGPSYDCGGTPEEPPFAEIVSAFWGKEEVELTDSEEQAIIQSILENPPEADCGDY